MSHFKDTPFYATFRADENEQKDFINFLKGELGFDWKFSSPVERPAVVNEQMQFYVYFSGKEGDNETDLTKPVIGWTLDYNEHLNDLYHYIDNRRELVYKLREFYGEAIRIPNNLRILLSDEQVSLLTEMEEFFRKDDKHFEADMLKDVLTKGFYRVEYQKILNNYINIYNCDTTLKESSETIGMLRELKASSKSSSEIDNLQKQIDYLEKQMADLMAVRPPHTMSDLIKKVEPVKHWDTLKSHDIHYKIGVDTANTDSLSSTVGHHRKQVGSDIWGESVLKNKIHTTKKYKWPDGDTSLAELFE